MRPARSCRTIGLTSLLFLALTLPTRAGTLPAEALPLPNRVATAEVVVTIAGDKWKTLSPKELPESTFAIDPSKDPKTFDRIRKDKDDAKNDVVDKCIYKLDGDALTICSGYTPGGEKAEYGTTERPKEFKSIGGGVIHVYKRMKD